MEDYGLITSVMPTGGWCFPQPLNNGGEQRIPPKGCAGTFEALCHQITTFRANNHIDIGDVESEASAYIRRVSPISDKYPGREFKGHSEAPEKRKGVFYRVRDWIRSVEPKRPKLILEEEAKERAEICHGCRQNVEWKGACIPCHKDVSSRGQNLRQRPSSPFADKLKACRCHNFYLPASVFIDRDFLGPRNPNAPTECWM
jgi:hypothetical protein